MDDESVGIFIIVPPKLFRGVQCVSGYGSTVMNGSRDLSAAHASWKLCGRHGARELRRDPMIMMDPSFAFEA